MALSECVSFIDKTGLELVEHGNRRFPIACYHDNLKELAVDWHWHEELELILVSEGSAIIAVDSERHMVHEGDGFFINSGVLHGCWSLENSKCRFHSIVFHPRLVGGSSDSVFWKKYLNPILNHTSFKSLFLRKEEPWQQEALQSLDNAWFACVEEQEEYEFLTRNELSKFMFLISQHLDEKKEMVTEKQMRDSSRMKTMLEYIGNYSSDNITMKEIAASASLSESECLRCFHNTIGTTPIQYLKSYRIKNAAELLSNTEMKIVDIGIACGFQDMSYFAKAFRGVYGCTPSEYRGKK